MTSTQAKVSTVTLSETCIRLILLEQELRNASAEYARWKSREREAQVMTTQAKQRVMVVQQEIDSIRVDW